MDRQKFLKLETSQEREAAARRFVEGRGFSPYQVDALCLFAGQGERGTVNRQAVTTCVISKSDAGKRLPCAANTFMAAVRHLEAIGVVGVGKSTRPWTYVVNWTRIDKVEKPPDDPLAAIAQLAVCREVWSAPVSAGQPVRDSVNKDSLESVSYRDSVSSRDTNRLTELDQPWARDGGFTDAELVHCVTTYQMRPLRRLYDEAVRLGWVRDSEDNRHRFLTICHHAATCSGVGRRMGLLVSRTKRGLRVTRIRQQSVDWAARLLGKRAETDDLVGAERGDSP
jgi:hypothetical protein